VRPAGSGWPWTCDSRDFCCSFQAIEFIEDVKSIKLGEGGYAEDREYFGEPASI
jgi:hypothetical protein